MGCSVAGSPHSRDGHYRDVIRARLTYRQRGLAAVVIAMFTGASIGKASLPKTHPLPSSVSSYVIYDRDSVPTAAWATALIRSYGASRVLDRTSLTLDFRFKIFQYGYYIITFQTLRY